MRFSLSIYPSRNAYLISYTTPSEASEGTFNDTEKFSALFSLHHCLIFEESSSSVPYYTKPPRKSQSLTGRIERKCSL